MDADTELSPHSFDAALRAAGAVVEAVRSVCATPREARNAFCAMRPPGHHAGPHGAVGGQSAGFCLLSSAAIGAAYARCVHRATVSRVALVDFDVHHGNGSEVNSPRNSPRDRAAAWPRADSAFLSLVNLARVIRRRASVT